MQDATPLEYGRSLPADSAVRHAIRLALAFYFLGSALTNLMFSAVSMVARIKRGDLPVDLESLVSFFAPHTTIVGSIGAALGIMLVTRSSALRPMLFTAVGVHIGFAILSSVRTLMNYSAMGNPAGNLEYQLIGNISVVGYGLFLILLARRDVVTFLRTK